MSKKLKMLIVLLALVAIVCAIIFVPWKGIWNKMFHKNNPTDEVVQTTTPPTTVQEDNKDNKEEEKWLHYYNSDLQSDDDELNDFNFGPDPTAAVEEHLAEHYDEVFHERLKKDPALAAAAMAWIDRNVGTRYLGDFYESCSDNWVRTINSTKVKFANDQMTFYKSLDAFFAFLGKVDSVEVRECKDVTDYMYMNPYTVDGVPDVIVLETKEHTGYQLVYTFMIKDEKIEVAFRINCGFQPTDVAEIPAASSYKPPVNPPIVVTWPDDNPTPDTKPLNPKDPSKAPTTNTEPNDNPGPGPNTNNPEDPYHSTEDRPTNSNHYDSYDDYRKDMEELAKINDEQKVGGDPNTPTTVTPPDTTVDSNAENGTGYGGIDKPTDVQPVVHEAETGKTITTPGEAWGGPPD